MTATADPADELFHPVGDHPSWSESYYFNFVDPEKGVGAFTRMGFRPNDGWADALHAVYLPEGRVAFTYGRRTDLTPAVVETLGPVDPAVGNLVLRRGEAFARWDIVYSGEAQDMDDPTVMLAASRDRPDGWMRPAQLEMDVAFVAISAPHYAVGGAQGHFEQTGRVNGTIRLGDEQWEVERVRRARQVLGPAHLAGAERDCGQGRRSRGARAGLLPELVLDELRCRARTRRSVRQDGRRHVPRQGLDPARR